ncbi:N amino acid transport system protein [Cyphellophora attinorum]|uniref:N amino acid transport system protein n=1 Tax=Cyphellophora attinorum TaxID=1664694 RepID=A0A0N0NL95_9EURO|nr:N amino acid transport system protein [Phialophora attinorum]KPI38779.1 N amino acid transport system protein [Phialophora attinorum]
MSKVQSPAALRHDSDATTAFEPVEPGDVQGGPRRMSKPTIAAQTRASERRFARDASAWTKETLEELSAVRQVRTLSSAAEPVVGGAVGADNPFAGHVEGGVNYMSLTWWRAGMLMVAETISLGILALPAALATLGLIPGLILLLFFGILATYTGYVIGQLRLRHENIHSMADAGQLISGRILSEGVCAVVYLFGGFVLSFALTIPRTLRHVSYYSVASFLSIIGAVLVTMIAISMERPGWVSSSTVGLGVDLAPTNTPQIALWPKKDLQFHQAFSAVCNIVFAYAGHVAFFAFISELKDPKDFPKALTFLQVSDISMYIVTAVVIVSALTTTAEPWSLFLHIAIPAVLSCGIALLYIYAGDSVASPAYSAPLRCHARLPCNGIALPTILIAGVINGHVAVKWLYVRLLRSSSSGQTLMHEKTFKARGIWIAIAATLWIVAWLIAEIVPVFHDLVGLTGALFGSWFTYGIQGVFWLWMNYELEWKGVSGNNPKLKRRGKWEWGWKKVVLTMVNVGCFVVGAVIFVAGIYSSAINIHENARHAGKPFSCTIG